MKEGSQKGKKKGNREGSKEAEEGSRGRKVTLRCETRASSIKFRSKFCGQFSKATTDPKSMDKTE